MRTYEQDLKELNITAEEYNNIISYMYDKTAEEITILVRAIKDGANVLKPVKYALERVLDMRYTDRQEAYYIYYGI